MQDSCLRGRPAAFVPHANSGRAFLSDPPPNPVLVPCPPPLLPSLGHPGGYTETRLPPPLRPSGGQEHLSGPALTTALALPASRLMTKLSLPL